MMAMMEKTSVEMTMMIGTGSCNIEQYISNIQASVLMSV